MAVRTCAAVGSRNALAPSFSNNLFFRSRSHFKRASRFEYACARRVAMTLTLNSEAIRDAFQAWHAERKTLDAQLNESLSALSAYQSHLDAWQQQLAREREELRLQREQFDCNRAAADKSSAEASAATLHDLNAARDKITAL